MNQSNKMKKLISLSVFLVFFGINQLAVQAQNNTSIQATALVLESLTVTAGNPLNFGQVLLDQTSAIDENNANSGTVNIIGTSGALVDASINFPAILTKTDDNSQTISIDTPAVFLNDGTNINNLNNINNPSFQLTGNDNLIFTGSIEPSNIAPGAYEATIDVTITYQ